MISLHRLSFLSLLLGALAVPTAFAAVYAQASHIPCSGIILQWMDKMGLVKQSNDFITTLTEQSIFAINDQNGIDLLFAAAIILGVTAIGCALAAEYQREPTLYLSVGYVSGAVAIVLIKLTAGIVLFMAGVFAVLVHRHERHLTLHSRGTR